MLQSVPVPAQVRHSGLRDQQEVQQHLHTAHRTDQPVSEDGEEAKQERGADAGQQRVKTGYQTTQGAGYSVQVVRFDHEPSAVQHHTGGHPVRSVRSHI